MGPKNSLRVRLISLTQIRIGVSGTVLQGMIFCGKQKFNGEVVLAFSGGGKN